MSKELVWDENEKVTVGVPCRENIPIQVLVAHLNMIKPEYYFLSNNFVPVDKSRNDIAAKFLCMHPDSNYLLFLDSDIIPTRELLLRLWRHQAPIVGALYFQKYPPFFPVAGCRVPKEKTKAVHLLVSWKYGDTFEVDAIGMGATLIRRDVFQEMKYPWFEFTDLSEDFEFIYRAQQVGFKTLLDSSIICPHRSDTVFIDADFYRLFQQRLLQSTLSLEGKQIFARPQVRLEQQRT